MRKPIIAIDIDDTLILDGYPDIKQARLVSGAKEYIDRIKAMVDCELIAWTCRHTEQTIQEAIQFLKKRGIEFDYVNENSPMLIQGFGDCRKVFCDVLIDDCALAPTIYDWSDSPVNWKKAFEAVRRRLLVKGFPLKDLSLKKYTGTDLDLIRTAMRHFISSPDNSTISFLTVFPHEMRNCSAVGEAFMNFYKDVYSIPDGEDKEPYDQVELRHLCRLQLLYNNIPLNRMTTPYIPRELTIQE